MIDARIKKKVHRIMDLCFDAKDFGHDCFFNYSPHVQQFEFYLYKNGWIEEKKQDIKRNTYLNDDSSEIELDKMIEFLENLIEES